MAASILLSVDKDQVSVAPGASVEFSVKAENLTALLDQVALRIDGIDAAWVQIIPPYLPVFAQGTASARVVISPPSNPSRALAGAYALTIIGSPQEAKGDDAQAQLKLEVQMIADYQIRLSAVQQHSQIEAGYPLLVHNSANAPLTLRFGGGDKGEALWYKFEPFELNVPAGGDAASTLTVRSKQLTTDRRAIPFTVTADGSFALRGRSPVAALSHSIAAQFVQAAPAALVVTISPAQADGQLSAIYTVTVGNPGSTVVTVRLQAAADGTPLTFQLDPAQLSLGAQAEARGRLTVAASSPIASSERRPYDFRVAASSADGMVLPAVASGRFVQVGAPKPFPWLLVFAVTFLALIILCGLLLLVISQVGTPR